MKRLYFSNSLFTNVLYMLLYAFACLGCKKDAEPSRKLAVEHVSLLSKRTQKDAENLRQGLPKGAALLRPFFEKAGIEPLDYQTADRALRDARGYVEDLRKAKSDFFLIAQSDGRITRNNLEQDDMAGENLFRAYPPLKRVLKNDAAEALGTWAIAKGVKGRADAQWITAVPIKGQSQTLGVYASGWSWSRYAERLESQLRDQVLKETAPGQNVPLIYAYILVEGAAYGAPIAPMVNIETFLKTEPSKRIEQGKLSEVHEILGTPFGIALQEVPSFEKKVAIVVFRSEI